MVQRWLSFCGSRTLWEQNASTPTPLEHQCSLFCPSSLSYKSTIKRTATITTVPITAVIHPIPQQTTDMVACLREVSESPSSSLFPACKEHLLHEIECKAVDH